MRYERKFFISSLAKYEIESLIKLHPAAFSEIYYERAVNNIYFDSLGMKSYFENIHGAEKRMKVRIRWYGDFLGRIENPVLELKIKAGPISNKVSFPLSGFRVDCGLSRDTLQDIFNSSQIPDVLKLDLMCLNVSLFNSYRRKYYLSQDTKYRLTLDSKLEFYEAVSFRNSFLNKSVDHINSILEVKYDRVHNDGANKITSFFPFRMTRSSKYIMGLERLNLTKAYSHI